MGKIELPVRTEKGEDYCCIVDANGKDVDMALIVKAINDRPKYLELVELAKVYFAFADIYVARVATGGDNIAIANDSANMIRARKKLQSAIADAEEE